MYSNDILFSAGNPKQALSIFSIHARWRKSEFTIGAPVIK